MNFHSSLRYKFCANPNLNAGFIGFFVFFSCAFFFGSFLGTFFLVLFVLSLIGHNYLLDAGLKCPVSRLKYQLTRLSCTIPRRAFCHAKCSRIEFLGLHLIAPSHGIVGGVFVKFPKGGVIKAHIDENLVGGIQ